jgi:hypothetical protein
MVGIVCEFFISLHANIKYRLMKNFLLVFISLMISVTGFSQTSGKDFLQNRKPARETRYECKSKSFKDMDKKEQEQYLQMLTQKKLTTPSKSPKTIKQCLDSIVYPQSYKEIFSYDNKGNHTMYESYNFDENENGWIGSFKKELTFDANSNNTMITYYNWDYDNNDWIVSFKEEFEYDDKGNITMQAQYSEWGNNKVEYEYDDKGNEIVNVRYDWDDANNDWIKMFRGESTYDDYDNQILYIDYEWVNNGWIAYYKIEKTFNDDKQVTFWIIYEIIEDKWVEASKGESTYDTHGNETSYVESMWDGEGWIEMFKYQIEYDYDPAGNIILLINYFWEDDGWVISSKSIYEYDDVTGNITMSVSYIRDYEINDLVGFEKYIYQYTDGNLSCMITYQWENNDWVNAYKYDFTYDVAGNMTSYISNTWENNTWVKADKYEYTFDLDYTLNDLLFPPDFYMENKKMEEKNYYWDGTDWMEDYIVTYYWSEKDIIGGVPDGKPQKNTITVYPNPTTGELIVEIAGDPESSSGRNDVQSIEVFDIYGRMVSSHHLITSSSHHLINISHLPAGIYFLRIENQTVKVVKQ